MEQKHSSEGLGPEFSEQEKGMLREYKARAQKGEMGGPKDKPREGREFVMHPEPVDLSWKEVMMSERGQEFWQKFSKEERLNKMLDTWQELFYDSRFHNEGAEQEMRRLITEEAGRDQIADALLERLEIKPDYALFDLYRSFARPEDTQRLGALLLQDKVMREPLDRSDKTMLVSLLATKGDLRLALEALSQFAERVRDCDYADLSAKGLDPPPAKRAADQWDILRAVEQLEKRIEDPAMTYAAGPQERDALLKEAAILRAQARVYMRDAEDELSEWVRSHPEWAGRFIGRDQE
ncbi:MAG: hypothetical protein A2806_01500 [Candidatus Terrybacteria bacterium RIFCSPHIGHO2_01_FULL_48_17]|uniref:Uncharacterized protein n=1 Tax=Candidatus Terrybacteria bacterium RIFCSPHIGHO2_01_FULL_48_17 TaxID=1802362 RepID=A0A1G2PHK3_9BACT|nr:MAG: hypothetical protein A2806_01500 [Candidatus Terrybacteria bacterium RIFCSPHIGHO2_01_FULL_48_17]OHA52275.1 MAG: hypothetical protein A3A30_04760 [Candidatus Terrybacteria bacterium RIFCSPLOWO2_01_FULL_48_14]